MKRTLLCCENDVEEEEYFDTQEVEDFLQEINKVRSTISHTSESKITDNKSNKNHSVIFV